MLVSPEQHGSGGQRKKYDSGEGKMERDPYQALCLCASPLFVNDDTN